MTTGVGDICHIFSQKLLYQSLAILDLPHNPIDSITRISKVEEREGSGLRGEEKIWESGKRCLLSFLGISLYKGGLGDKEGARALMG